jgi:hypothetical protein
MKIQEGFENRDYSFNELVVYMFKDFLNVKRIGCYNNGYYVFGDYKKVDNAIDGLIGVNPIPLSQGLFTVYFVLDKNKAKGRVLKKALMNNDERNYQNYIGGLDEIMSSVWGTDDGNKIPKYGCLTLDYHLFNEPVLGLSRVHSLQLFQ